jgi:murein DD-endopeptidase MepM/ murein hydrolase activator NlpD
MPTLPPVQPWNNDKLISGFGMRVNPFHKGLYEHPGVDITMPRGTSVIASSSGTVRQVKRSNLQAGYGNYIEIDHGHGFVTRYAHLEEIKVKLYERVAKGSVVGTVGSSGGSIAPHLHYEILRDGRNVDPVTYMIEGLTSEDHHVMKVLSRKKNQSLD